MSLLMCSPYQRLTRRFLVTGALSVLSVVPSCRHDLKQEARTSSGAALSGILPCVAGQVNSDKWSEVQLTHASFALRLPPGHATHFARTDHSVVGESWSTPGAWVSYRSVDWGPAWLDTATADFAPGSLLCGDTVAGAVTYIRSYFGHPGPLSEGQYVIGYRPLKRGDVLVLLTYSRDSSSRDSLVAVVRSLRAH